MTGVQKISTSQNVSLRAFVPFTFWTFLLLSLFDFLRAYPAGTIPKWRSFQLWVPVGVVDGPPLAKVYVTRGGSAATAKRAEKSGRPGSSHSEVA